jgi:hypothetical protein
LFCASGGENKIAEGRGGDCGKAPHLEKREKWGIQELFIHAVEVGHPHLIGQLGQHDFK